jgi:hypothetical protein
VPASIGVSLDDYYQDSLGRDQRFGYFDLGIEASLALPDSFLGGGVISAGAHWLHLGTTPQQFNDNRRDEFIASLGIGYSF